MKRFIYLSLASILLVPLVAARPAPVDLEITRVPGEEPSGTLDTATVAAINAQPTTSSNVILGTDKASATASVAAKAATTRTITTPTRPTFTPEQFPPKKGQSIQCVVPTPGPVSPPSIVIGLELSVAMQQACSKIFAGGSKWVEKGDPYTQVVTVAGRAVKFQVKVWLGGFNMTYGLCAKQISAVRNECSFGNPPVGTFGGCSYTDDLNLQMCIFPTFDDVQV
ncbi:hypothetical protein TWF281_007560 [Arthrobotrys megalospora]